MNILNRLKFIYNNDKRPTPYVSSPLFEKCEILIWVFILKMDNIHILLMRYSYLVIRVFISDRGIQRLIKNKNITVNEKLKEKKIERYI
jgi:hypothetical protein